MEHGNSILTPALREFVGEDDHGGRSRADVSQKRKAIRRRLRDALLDCERLLDNPNEAQLDRVFDARRDDVSERDVSDLRMGMSSMVGLLWLLCRRDERATSFRAAVANGVDAGYLADGFEADTFVEIETYEVEPVHRVADRALSKDPTDPDEMSNRELEALARVGELTADEYERAVDARFDALRDEGLFDHDGDDGEQEGGDDE